MASTYSSLKIELIGSGEQSGAWGTTTNTNLGTAVEEAVVGSADVAFSSADVTVTLTDVNTTQTARHLRLNLTGTSGGSRQLILGSGCQIEKPYLINNGLADQVTVKNTTGTGVVVPAGKTMWVYNNGTNVVDAVTHLSSLTLSAALPAGSGGTGLTSPGSNGNVLTSNGTAWVSSAPSAQAYPAAGMAVSTGTAWATSKTTPSGDVVGTTDTQTLTNKTLTSPAVTTQVSTGTRETRVAMGANDVNLASGNYFSKTISGATTLTVSNVPTTGTAVSFILDLTNGGSAVITWWSGTKWASGVQPTLTSSGRDVLGFFTYDGGTTWTGLLLGKDVK